MTKMNKSKHKLRQVNLFYGIFICALHWYGVVCKTIKRRGFTCSVYQVGPTNTKADYHKSQACLIRLIITRSQHTQLV